MRRQRSTDSVDGVPEGGEEKDDAAQPPQERVRRRRAERKAAAAAFSRALHGGAAAESKSNSSVPIAQKDTKVIVLLENASLETVKTGRAAGASLLTADEHKGILRKLDRDPAELRPDITHQCLLALLDSPLNKAGRLKVYVRTTKSVLIDVHPQTRIPRTFRRFAGLMAELLNKFSIRATNGSDVLLKVIRNPITAYLPVGCQKYLFSYSSQKMVNVVDHAAEVAKQQPEAVVYVIGAMASGKVDADWTEDTLSLSNFALSGACVCNRLTHGYELAFSIL